jgi:mersacidin/lichenicidin family type 2 lantibiotic
MTKEMVIRAWRDLDFRTHMTESQRAMLPENPAGDIEVKDLGLFDNAAFSVHTCETVCSPFSQATCCC